MSVTTIQVLNRIGASGAPASLFAGELAYNQPDTTTPTTPGDALYCGDGVNVNLLVGADRQVELAGAQTITGIKTFTSIANLKIEGGDDGYLIQTDGEGNLSFTNAPGGGLTQVAVDGTTIEGNGTTEDPLSVIAGSTTVSTNATLTGNGSTTSPLGVVANSVPVATNATLTGNGTAASPLGTVAGGTAIATNTQFTGNGTTASPLAIPSGAVSVATDGVTLTGFGTTGVPLAILAVQHNNTLSGNGTAASPLAVVAGAVAVQADGVTLTGMGTTANPLALLAVQTNNTLTGAGTAASPLGVVAGTVPVVTDGVTLSGTGVTGSPLSVQQLASARQIGIVATGGTTITETPASFNGSANVNITNFEVTNLDCGTY